MNNDIAVLESMQIKPAFGQPCNNCGWCCLTEVCVVGRELTGNSKAPCTLLISKGGKHYCKVAEHLQTELSIGTGCDAKTQTETLQEMI